jgi:hypothetical protein
MAPQRLKNGLNFKVFIKPRKKPLIPVGNSSTLFSGAGFSANAATVRSSVLVLLKRYCKKWPVQYQ